MLDFINLRPKRCLVDRGLLPSCSYFLLASKEKDKKILRINIRNPGISVFF
jgi:hypothetical protein